MAVTNQTIAIFGDNEYAIGMILESLYAQYQEFMDIIIVVNREFKPKHSFNDDLHRTTICHENNFVATNNTVGFLAGMSPESRHFLWERYEKKYSNVNFPLLVHPSAVLPHHIKAGPAVRIEPNVTIAPFVEIGKAVLINRGTIIGHHTTLGDFVNINPGAIVNGICSIGARSSIGAGAIINDGITIGQNCLIGSGSLVTRDIPDNTTAYGSPAKPVESR